MFRPLHAVKRQMISLQIFTLIALAGVFTSPAVAAVIPYNQVVASMNPIAYWRHEDDGTDSSPNAHDGSIGGTPTFVSGPALPGITGNSAGSYGAGFITNITVPDDDVLSFGNSITDAPFSISTWINPDTPSGSFNGIIGKDNGTQREWALLMLSDRSIRMFIKNNGGNNQLSVDTTFNAPLSTWTHLAVTYDGSSTVGGLNIWVNGASATLTNPISNTYTAMSNTTASLTLGSYAANFFEGQIDETALFNVVLSEAQISALAGTAQFAIPEPGTFVLLGLGISMLQLQRSRTKKEMHGE